MRQNHLVHFFCIMLLLLNPLAAQKSPIKFTPSNVPEETKILSQLFGNWDAYQVSRNQDGSWSSDTTHYEWRWYSILDGQAIQDDWIKLESAEGKLRTPQIVGTNIRIYNPDENQWHMAWIDKTNRKLATFTARNEDDAVVMSGKNVSGREVRNTFFNIEKNEFSWKQEWTFDSGNSWVSVSKIQCKRKKQ